MGAAGFEMDAGDVRAGRGVDAEWLGVWAAYDAVAKELPLSKRFVCEDREAAGTEIEYEFDGTVGKQALFGVWRGGGFHDPDHFDEAVEGRGRLVAVGQHGASLLLSTNDTIWNVRGR